MVEEDKDAGGGGEDRGRGEESFKVYILMTVRAFIFIIITPVIIDSANEEFRIRIRQRKINTEERAMGRQQHPYAHRQKK